MLGSTIFNHINPTLTPLTATIMEVHAHTHTPRKKWSHYFLEFIMLFRDVVCGILGKYNSEHIVERNTKNEYIVTMIEDLRSDTAELNDEIELAISQLPLLDTLIEILNYGELDQENID